MKERNGKISGTVKETSKTVVNGNVYDKTEKEKDDKSNKNSSSAK